MRNDWFIYNINVFTCSSLILDEQEIQNIKVDLELLFSLKLILISKGLYNK